MKIQEAINKIKELGFNATLWENHGKQRIYIDFNFKGSNRRGGFVGREKTELVAEPCGKHTKEYQSKLNEIASWDIEWTAIDEEKNDYRVGMETLKDTTYTTLEKERIIKAGGWELSHDL